MENTTTKNPQNKIVLTDRNNLVISGVSKMISSNDTMLAMTVSGTRLNITGKAIRIEKLDTENGNLEASGEFDSIKFCEKGGLIKRIFK